MAHHGGRPRTAPPGPTMGPTSTPPPPLPRVHALRPLPLVPEPEPDPVPEPEPAEVSLATPRPDGQRRVNEYVQTPLQGVTVTREPYRQSVTLPVRHQPTSFKKEPHPPHPHPPPPAPRHPPPQRTSILCPGCGRCRCEACRERRPLPSRWLCDDACFCSAETTVDYASCLCCVKGLFYHCGGDGEEPQWDDPCSCAPAPGGASRRCARWSCLALASVALPCLLCYWPLRGLVRATELCYARYCDNGCRCERRPHPHPHPHPLPSTPTPHPHRSEPALLTPEKRLLDAD